MFTPPAGTPATLSPAEMQVLMARAGLVLNPGQMADLVLVWRQLAGLIALLPRERPMADDQAFVFRLPAPAGNAVAEPAPGEPAAPGHAAFPGRATPAAARPARAGAARAKPTPAKAAAAKPTLGRGTGAKPAAAKRSRGKPTASAPARAKPSQKPSRPRR